MDPADFAISMSAAATFPVPVVYRELDVGFHLSGSLLGWAMIAVIAVHASLWYGDLLALPATSEACNPLSRMG